MQYFMRRNSISGMPQIYRITDRIDYRVERWSKHDDWTPSLISYSRLIEKGLKVDPLTYDHEAFKKEQFYRDVLNDEIL